MPTIGEVLNRRSDLSTFCVHLTRGELPGESLRSILATGTIQARSAMGWARDAANELGGEAQTSQKVVCFSETPLEQIYTLVAPIEGRQVILQPYGVAFTKMVVRRKGANPVWYVDETPGRPWVIAEALNQLRDSVKGQGIPGFESSPTARIFPFCEAMGTWPSNDTQKEFWWEREWRHVGDFQFAMTDVALIIAPEGEHEELRRELGHRCVDAIWSLERMIAALVGLSAADVSPFSTH